MLKLKIMAQKYKKNLYNKVLNLTKSQILMFKYIDSVIKLMMKNYQVLSRKNKLKQRLLRLQAPSTDEANKV